MIQHTSEWVAKAEGDYATATRELAVGPDSNFDAVAFHAQQCAEKYLKARLIEEGATFPKTHDLAAILDLLISFEPGWNTLRAELERLTDRAVEVTVNIEVATLPRCRCKPLRRNCGVYRRRLPAANAVSKVALKLFA